MAGGELDMDEVYKKALRGFEMFRRDISDVSGD
jgi:hypothetical protein